MGKGKFLSAFSKGAFRYDVRTEEEEEEEKEGVLK